MSDNNGSDFLGYNRRVYDPGTVLSSEYATLAFGSDGENMLLMQQVSVNYGHQVRGIPEIGTPDIYWVTGSPMGQVAVSRAVGQEGFLAKFRAGVACAQLTSMRVGLNGRGGCVQVQGGKGFTLTGCMPESVAIGIAAGQTELTESMSIRVASLKQN